MTTKIILLLLNRDGPKRCKSLAPQCHLHFIGLISQRLGCNPKPHRTLEKEEGRGNASCEWSLQTNVPSLPSHSISLPSPPRWASGRVSTHDFSGTPPPEPWSILNSSWDQPHSVFSPRWVHRAALSLPPPPWASRTESQHELLGLGQRRDERYKAVIHLIWCSKHHRASQHPLKVFRVLLGKWQAHPLKTLTTLASIVWI